MLVVAESHLVTCGAVVGSDGQNTVIVFHPALSVRQRIDLATELLTEQEMEGAMTWQVTLAS